MNQYPGTGMLYVPVPVACYPWVLEYVMMKQTNMTPTTRMGTGTGTGTAIQYIEIAAATESHGIRGIRGAATFYCNIDYSWNHACTRLQYMRALHAVSHSPSPTTIAGPKFCTRRRRTSGKNIPPGLKCCGLCLGLFSLKMGVERKVWATSRNSLRGCNTFAACIITSTHCTTRLTVPPTSNPTHFE